MSEHEPVRQWARTSSSPMRYMLGEVCETPEGTRLRAPIAAVTRAAVPDRPPPPEGLPDVEAAALAARQAGFPWRWEAESPGGTLHAGPATNLTDAMRHAEHVAFGPLVGPPFEPMGGLPQAI